MKTTNGVLTGSLSATAIALIAAIYACKALNGIPLADEWRWMNHLLIPYLNGKISFLEYITGEYSFFGHTHFLTLAALLINYNTSSLNLIHLAHWGLIFYFAGWVILLRSFYQRSTLKTSSDWLVLLGITASYFTLTTDFPWLLVVYEYFYYFFAIVVLIIFNRHLEGKSSLNLVLASSFFAPILLDSFGSIAIASGTFLILINARHNKNACRTAFLVITAYSLAWILLKIALGNGISTASTSRLSVLLALLNTPLDILQSLLITFSQPILDKAILIHFFPESYRAIQVFIGIVGIGFVSIVSIAYWKFATPRKSQLPLLLVAFGFIAWTLILLTRYLDFGIAVFDAQRFTRFFTLYYVGAGAALLLGSFRPLVKTMFSLLILLGFTLTTIFQYKNLDNVNSYFHNASIALKQHTQGDQEITKYIGQCANGYCDDTIEFLRIIDAPIVSKK